MIALFLNLKLLFSLDVVPFVVCGILLHDEGDFVLVFRQIPLACCTRTTGTLRLLWRFFISESMSTFLQGKSL